MARPMRHVERHRSERIGWLRAAVMGANDGIVSTASLVLGVAGAGAARGDVIVAGVAGLVAGAKALAVLMARLLRPGDLTKGFEKSAARLAPASWLQKTKG